MSVHLSLIGNAFQFFNTNGRPLSLGSLYTFAAGTSTPQTTYTDSAGSVPNANPIVLDASGRMANEIWLTDGQAYKFVLKDAGGSTIGTYDNITGIGDPNLANLLAASSGSSLIGFIQSGAGATARTVQARLRDIVNVKDFGATGNGTSDDTSAIQAAINSFGAGNGTVYFPAGTYKVTSTLTVSQSRIDLVGQGPWVSQIAYAPGGNSTCISITAGAAIIYEGSVRDLSLHSSDATFTKVGIKISDASEYLIDNVIVTGTVSVGGTTYWSGANSIGIQIAGRQAGLIRRVYVSADIPLKISTNPNSGISIDHHHFTDCYLIANGNPVVTIDSGVNLTNVAFDGYQAWVKGTAGLSWIDTTTASSSINLSLKNVRWEQTTLDAGYAVDIEHNTTLSNLLIENLYSGNLAHGNGVKLRKVNHICFNNWQYAGTGTSLDTDQFARPMILSNCFWQTGSASAVNAGITKIFDSGASSAAGPLSSFVIYDVPAGATNYPTFSALQVSGLSSFSGLGIIGKAIVNNNAAAAYTVAANISYVGFTGTQVGTVAFTFPAGAATIDGLIITIFTQGAVGASSTWASAGASFIGAPGTLGANSTTRFIYNHAGLTWLPA